MKTKLTIILDLDSICADLLTPWLAAYNAEFDDNLTVEDIKTFDILDYVKAEARTKTYDYISEPGFYRALQPLPGAIEGVAELKRQGHDVLHVTAGAKGPNTASEKLEWCAEHFGVSRHDVIIAHRKELIRGDVFIDDCPEKTRAYALAWPKAMIGTIAYPYNWSQVQCAWTQRFDSYRDTAFAWKCMTDWIESIERAPDGSLFVRRNAYPIKKWKRVRDLYGPNDSMLVPADEAFTSGSPRNNDESNDLPF